MVCGEIGMAAILDSIILFYVCVTSWPFMNNFFIENMKVQLFEAKITTFSVQECGYVPNLDRKGCFLSDVMEAATLQNSVGELKNTMKFEFSIKFYPHMQMHSLVALSTIYDR